MPWLTDSYHKHPFPSKDGTWGCRKHQEPERTKSDRFDEMFSAEILQYTMKHFKTDQ